MFSQNLSNIFDHFNFEMSRESGMEEKKHFKEGLTIIRVFIYIVKEETLKTLLEVKRMTKEIKQEEPITLTEKIATAVLIAYLISLIWLAGSSHWFGIW
jgi:hypothetical protein